MFDHEDNTPEFDELVHNEHCPKRQLEQEFDRAFERSRTYYSEELITRHQ